MARLNLSWAQSADRQGVSRSRTRFVIKHCGCPLVIPAELPDRPDERQLYLGDDTDGNALEVMAVELLDGTLRVIHSMPLRAAYRKKYREVKQWRQ